MAINLAAQMKARGTRRKAILIDLPDPIPSFERELERMYMKVVRIWAAEAVRVVTEEYRPTLAEQVEVQTDSVGSIRTALRTLDNKALQAILTFSREYEDWSSRYVRAHYRRFIQRLKYATNVDLTTQLTMGGNRVTLEALLQRNIGLVTSVSDQIRERITDAVYAGLTSRKPVVDIARDIRNATDMGAARARRIASDQSVKLSSALDEERIRQVGEEGYVWSHSDKVHFRPEHKARDGDFIEFGSEIDKEDPPGFAPFCGCKRRIRLRLD